MFVLSFYGLTSLGVNMSLSLILYNTVANICCYPSLQDGGSIRPMLVVCAGHFKNENLAFNVSAGYDVWGRPLNFNHDKGVKSALGEKTFI